MYTYIFQYCSVVVAFSVQSHVKVFMSAFHVKISAFDVQS